MRFWRFFVKALKINIWIFFFQTFSWWENQNIYFLYFARKAKKNWKKNKKIYKNNLKDPPICPFYPFFVCVFVKFLQNHSDWLTDFKIHCIRVENWICMSSKIIDFLPAKFCLQSLCVFFKILVFYNFKYIEWPVLSGF